MIRKLAGERESNSIAGREMSSATIKWFPIKNVEIMNRQRISPSIIVYFLKRTLKLISLKVNRRDANF